jgi:outer membrane protein assembly factor BamB
MIPAMALRVLLMAAVIAGAAALSHEDGRARPAYPLPGRVATLDVGDVLGAVSGGAGDAWVDDRWSERLVRLDRRTGRVVARIPVQGRLALAAGAREVWALQSGGGYGRGLRGPLLRVDAATNRVIERIPLPALGFGVAVAGENVWVWGPDRLMRVSARSGQVVKTIAVPDHFGETTGFALLGPEPVISTADGHLVRFDPLTGRVLAAVSLGLDAPALQQIGEYRAVLAAGGSVVAVDPATGRALWQRRLGYRIGTVVQTDGALWAQGAYIRDPGDRVWRLDPRTGAIHGSALLPAFGTMGMAAVRGTLWVTAGSGRVIVLPLP